MTGDRLGGERAAMAAILVVTAAVYSRSLTNEFILDDWEQIVNNHQLESWSFVPRSFVSDILWFRDPLHGPQSPYYRPLHDLWLWVNFHLFGINPVGWHAAMIALHLIVVWLAYRVASALAGNGWTGVATAAIFALLPIHAEAVAWPAAISPPLSTAFLLGAFLMYLRANAQTSAGFALGRVPRQAMSLGLFACALLAYESSAVFPVLIAAHAFIFSFPQKYPSPAGRGQSPDGTIDESDLLGKGAATTILGRTRTAAIAMIPYAFVAVAYLGIRYLVLGFIEPGRGNQMAGMDLTPLQAAVAIPGALATYASILVLPWRAGPAHHLLMNVTGSVASPGFLVPAAGLAALLGLSVTILRHHPHRRLYLFSAAWSAIAISPMFHQTGIFVQDRYFYLPSFGLCLIAGDLLISFAQGTGQRAIAAGIATGAIALAYAATLVVVQGFWHDDVAVFSHCVEAVPQMEPWHYQLGLALASRGEYSRARDEFEQARDLMPDDGWNLYNLGRVYSSLGDSRASIETMAKGLAHIDHPSPDLYARLALTADAASDTAHADAALANLSAIAGGADTAILTRAQIRMRHGDSKGASDAIEELVRREPENPEALAARGAILASARRYDDALSDYEHAMRNSPHDANLHYQTAALLHQMGRDGDARNECAVALILAPGNRDAQALMASIDRAGAAH